MVIQEYFTYANAADILFDPTPSYGGIWYFKTNILKLNSKVEDGKNLWQEFYNKNYIEKVKKYFKTDYVLNMPINLVSMPNSDNIGRTLRFDRTSFFLGIINYLNHNIDNYDLSDEDKEKRIYELTSYFDKSNEEINTYFSECLNAKKRILKDVLDNEFNSKYFDAAMEDYAPFKNTSSFNNYINSLYEIISDLQIGLLKMDNFFDREIDINEFSSLFDADKFALMFAKIIIDSNLDKEELNNNYRYLCYYDDALTKLLDTNSSYHVDIIYLLKNNKKIRYTTNNFIDEYNKMKDKYNELTNFKFPKVSSEIKYKNISLMDKVTELNSVEKHPNWSFTNDLDSLKGNNSDNNYRIEILKKSGFLANPLKGENINQDLYAFIYESGIVIIENIKEDGKTLPTIVMPIDKFLELSNLKNVLLVDFVKSVDVGIKRIFHTSINNWQRNLFDEINGTYELEDAINFINEI